MIKKVLIMGLMLVCFSVIVFSSMCVLVQTDNVTFAILSLFCGIGLPITGFMFAYNNVMKCFAKGYILVDKKTNELMRQQTNPLIFRDFIQVRGYITKFIKVVEDDFP